MPTLPTVDPAALQCICGAYAAASWPLELDTLDDVAARLGWTLRGRYANGSTFTADLGFGDVRIRVLVTDGSAAKTTVPVSARSDRVEGADASDLETAYESIIYSVAESLDAHGEKARGHRPGTRWDLRNGGRIWVRRLDNIVTLELLQENYADLERFEERDGVRDERDPLADMR